MSEVATAGVAERLARRGLTLAVAESCTGGLLSARLSEREGASRFLLGGLVTYADDAKVSLLGIPADLLARHGAVSEPVARAMAEGARDALHADAGLGITGIAGPGGGSPEKPVGTVWIAAILGERTDARRFAFGGDRTAVREASVAAAIDMLNVLLEVE